MDNLKYYKHSDDSYEVLDLNTNMSYKLDKNVDDIITKSIGSSAVGFINIGGNGSGIFIQNTLLKEFNTLKQEYEKNN